MLIRLGAAISIMVQYLHRRGETYYLHMRIPAHLEKHYGKQFIRKTLGTKDKAEAVRLVEKLAKQQLAEFASLSQGNANTPADVRTAARALAQQYDMEHFIEHVIDPARAKHADGDELLYDFADPSQYLAPHQIEAHKIHANPKSLVLSEAFSLYIESHQRGREDAFITKVKRDWDKLIAIIGDVEFENLERPQARHLMNSLLNEGKKTTTVRRTINTLSAITNSVIQEQGLVRTNPFNGLKIPGEGKDTEQKEVATHAQLIEIREAMLPALASAPALLTLIQLEVGARIGELSGLAVDDVALDHEVPHIIIREQPWRSLKTDVSKRRVPVLGVAVTALEHALRLPRTGKALFEQYTGDRGNDSASAAVNKRLKPWKLTSHSLRHTLKDRLREVGCPKDVRDAIQGHSSGDIAEQYGQGHTLKTMREWLSRITLAE